jgi:cytochrome c oxidase subunit 1
MIASIPFDTQVHDTQFIVAHFHYTLIGGALFPLFGGLYYWFPKFTGRRMSESLGRWNFWLFFIGFNCVFFPLHAVGLLGMPRRVYTYMAETGWADLNLLASAGAAVMFVSVALFLANVFRSLRAGAAAGENPWGADTLEWATTSPPPSYNFAMVPVVEGSAALWDRSPGRPVVQGIRSDTREVLVTSVMDARPDHREGQPSSSIWPFLMAVVLGVSITIALFTPWGILPLVVFGYIVLLRWFWSEGRAGQ